MFRAYFFNRRNQLIVTFEVESMDAARAWASKDNKEPHTQLGPIEFIGNAERVAWCSRLTTIEAPSALPMFPGM